MFPYRFQFVKFSLSHHSLDVSHWPTVTTYSEKQQSVVEMWHGSGNIGGGYPTACQMVVVPMADSWGGAIAPPLPQESQKNIFLNVSENKFRDKKFSLIPFVLSTFYVE